MRLFELRRQPHRPGSVSQFKVAGGYTYAGANGVDRGLWQTDRNNFMRRIGLAYSINPKTVVRSPASVSSTIKLGIRNRHVSQVGYSQSTAYNASLDSGVTYVGPFANPFPNGFVQPVGNSRGAMTSVGNSITFFNPELQNALQQALGAEHSAPDWQAVPGRTRLRG
jgi:hypothetical protein